MDPQEEQSISRSDSQADKHGCLTGCIAIGLVAVLVLCLLLYGGVRLLQPRISEEKVESTVLTTLARESAASFLVTGALTFATTVESRSTRTVLPGILNLDLGTTTARVRAPGVVSYGFDVRDFESGDIRYLDNGVVDVRLPDISIFSVEPEMESLEIETEVGWARLYRGSGREREQVALREIRPRMRSAAEQYLTNQPAGAQRNTAEALVEMLTPVLETAGLEDPQFTFRFGNGEVLTLN
ncbi:MAG: DUF4230 domain-containing protein [Rubricoccaceae bacterium]|nr:DUF4230 domain-containing protein [Rubricoccaceae bacterium]